MVDITIQDNKAIFAIRGWSKLWALRDHVTVPISAIRAVRRAPPNVGRGWWKGWRLPGTQIPGVIVSGSFRQKGKWTFWDVRGAGDHAIEVDLEGTEFSRLIVDVADPNQEVRRLQSLVTR